MNPTDDDLNVQSPRAEGAPDFDGRKPEASLDHVREMLDHTRHTLLRTQRRIERNERQWKSLSRQLTALWVFVIMVIVGFGLLTWYQLYQLLVQKKP